MLTAPPAPTAPIPTAPAALVAALDRTRDRLEPAIRAWDKAQPPPRAVVLLTLYEQRAIRLVAGNARLADRVLHLEPALQDDIVARVDLTRLSTSTPLPKAPPQLGAAAPAARLLAWYRQAARRFHIRWQLLAAINFVESAFNKVRNVSGAGAQGPMQFEPATWRAYGLGGRIDEPHDAILGAANYLAANDGRRDERTALFRYNHSPLYVDAILRYAHRMQRDRYAFYEYYNWQVYFRTATGYRRLTGPR
jgi:soluble lytic murein transglycosylase-like protein